MPSEQNKADEVGATVLVILEAVGEDRSVLSLSGHTGCPNYGTPRQIDDGVYYAAVTVVPEWETQDRAESALVKWLSTNRDFLTRLNARKFLEYQSRIFPEQGSESLRLTIELLRQAAAANCEIRHQYIRVPTEDELQRFQT